MAGPGKRIGAACPPNSDFYICADRPSRFLGCCGIDPCRLADGNCPAERLAMATFNASAYHLIPAQACIDPASKWYTCAYTTPPFMGCCVENACGKGCAVEMLRAASLSTRAEAAGIFTLGWGGEPSTPTLRPSAPTLRPSAQATPINNGTSNQDEDGRIRHGVVAGIVTGSVIGGIALFAVLLFWWRRRVAREQARRRDGTSSESMTGSSFIQSMPQSCDKSCAARRESNTPRLAPTRSIEAPYLRHAGFGERAKDEGLNKALPPRPIEAAELEDPRTQHGRRR
ncbi:hypothetical protein CDD81_2808 [Ophiocordyceps australis]|uniref:Uncharacterized protein n=1 Tax=Ophiocordyceps australis TaxID=1399860 RepID=A0A2C5XW54_9HYPO|nr:hypothetical protein CDD81_2808 [Ophiocordyceps australis]